MCDIECGIGPLTFKKEEGELLAFAYRDTMGGPGNVRDDQLTLRSGGGDEGLICVEENQFLASNRWVRWYGHLT